MKKSIAWTQYSQEDYKIVHTFAEEYKQFVTKCKTERECITEVTRLADLSGFIDLNNCKPESVKPGDRLYYSDKNKIMALFIVGREPLDQGMRIIGSHVDSPRLDLKQIPLYEEDGLAMLKTHYYGGIKKYQWVTIPLSLHGVVCVSGGGKINLIIGEDPNDPILGISDLLEHLSGTQQSKKLSEAIEAEALNACAGSIPQEGSQSCEKVLDNVRELLYKNYRIREEDLATAELELVPSGRARDYGLDRSMIAAYGQDDRSCVYVSFRALQDIRIPDKTCICLLVDKEEIGNKGATGIASRFLEYAVSDLLDVLNCFSWRTMRKSLSSSKMLSADVSTALDPNYPDVVDRHNTAHLGYGVVISKYTGRRGKAGCNDASAEYLAELVSLMERNNISWQTAEFGKADWGGAGTIADIPAEYGMDVVDCGIALHNMHAPLEICSKADLYEAFRCYHAFYKEA